MRFKIFVMFALKHAVVAPQNAANTTRPIASTVLMHAKHAPPNAIESLWNQRMLD